MKFRLHADMTFYAEDRNWALMRLAGCLHDLLNNEDDATDVLEEANLLDEGFFELEAVEEDAP